MVHAAITYVPFYGAVVSHLGDIKYYADRWQEPQANLKYHTYMESRIDLDDRRGFQTVSNFLLRLVILKRLPLDLYTLVHAEKSQRPCRNQMTAHFRPLKAL